MNRRQIHLDFHTSEHIEGIGKDFSKKEFQDALIAAHANSITLFAKCHHGWSYHPTKANEMHPNLKFDLLGAQIEAAHEIGVKTPVYISAGVDGKTQWKHTDWLVRYADGRPTCDPFFPGWARICMNSPYLDELLAQIREVVENYDADGLFFDITRVQPCYCPNCTRTLVERGLDPLNETNVLNLAEEVYRNYYTRIRETVDELRPGLPIFHNAGHVRIGRRDLAFANTHLELESLPTGGWGYDHFPTSIAYSRNLGLDCTGMTGKFHTSWGEFGGFKHPNALKYEVALSIMNGAGCSIGDQMHPYGKLNPTTYKIIGEAYSELEKKEPWLENTSMITEVGVLSCEAMSDDDTSVWQGVKVPESDAGVGRILMEGKYLFDVLDTESDFTKYRVLILPDYIRIDKQLKEKIDKFIEQGGKILASGYSGLGEDDSFAFDFGAVYDGLSEFTPDYYRPYENTPEYDVTEFVIYAQGHKLKDITGTIRGYRQDSFFNRTREHYCSHKHTPNNPESQSCGIVEGKDGIYISWNIFEEYAVNGSLISKRMVEYALKLLINDVLLKTNLPSAGCATLMKQEKSMIAHLLYGAPVKRGNGICVIEDLIPVHDVYVSVKTNNKPKKVYLAPQRTEVDFEYKDGYTLVKNITVDTHQMIVFENCY